MTDRPKEWIEERQSGLIVARHEITAEQKRQRRADNKQMKLLKKKTRKRNRHGRRGVK